jgi:DNA polymerase-3 subunit gamma/tau
MAAAAPTAPVAPADGAQPNLAELWQQILAGLELPSTRMLLSQQAQLVRLDTSRAVVRVAGTWMAMVQSRLPLLEKALTQALGSPRQLVLESGGEPPRPSPAAAPQAVAPATTPPNPVAAPPVATPPVAATPAPPAASQSPSPQPQAAPPPPAPAQPPLPRPSNDLDSKARRLADFFNGEVVAFEGSLDDDGEQGSDAA